jgi:GNAT superfamily N-acetyltransferase
MSAATPSVRCRTPADLSPCVEILAATHTGDGYPQQWPDDPAAWLTPAHPLGTWVAVRGSRVVGHVALAGLTDPVPSPLASGTGLAAAALGAVTRLFVSTTERGGGTARALLETAAEAARVRGLRPVLDVFAESTAAVRFYERAGWTRVGSGLASWRTNSGDRAYVHYYAGPGEPRPRGGDGVLTRPQADGEYGRTPTHARYGESR